MHLFGKIWNPHFNKGAWSWNSIPSPSNLGYHIPKQRWQPGQTMIILIPNLLNLSLWAGCMEQISIQGMNSQGVRSMALAAGDSMVSVATLNHPTR